MMNSNLSVVTWNVNGIRTNVLGVLAKFDELTSTQSFPDIICIQETKLSPKALKSLNISSIEEIYTAWWSCSTCEAKGRSSYAGTSILVKKTVLERYGEPRVVREVPELDDFIPEYGRFISLEFDKFLVCSVYVPNSGTNMEDRKTFWHPIFHGYINDLERSCATEDKTLIVCGDFNALRTAGDVWWGEPAGNASPVAYHTNIMRKKANSPGAMPYEIDNFESLLSSSKLTDTWRHMHPNVVYSGYTWYNTQSKSRESGKGWRIDYILTNHTDIVYSKVLDTPENSSDHVPLLTIIKI